MDQYKEDFFDGFRSGQNFAWVVSRKDKNEPSKISTIVRKVDEEKLAFRFGLKKVMQKNLFLKRIVLKSILYVVLT